MSAATEAAREWVATMAEKIARYGSHADSAYFAADLCGHCAGFGDGHERTSFVHAFTYFSCDCPDARNIMRTLRGKTNCPCDICAGDAQ